MDISVEHASGDTYTAVIGGRSQHTVRATPSALARVTRSGESTEDSIARAFRFLLDREPPDSILRSFALEDIARYFPEFWSEMSR